MPREGGKNYERMEEEEKKKEPRAAESEMSITCPLYDVLIYFPGVSVSWTKFRVHGFKSLLFAIIARSHVLKIFQPLIVDQSRFSAGETRLKIHFILYYIISFISICKFSAGSARVNKSIKLRRINLAMHASCRICLDNNVNPTVAY